MDLKDLRVSGKRLQSALEQMAKIGATPGGGVQRLTLSTGIVGEETEAFFAMAFEQNNTIAQRAIRIDRRQ